ncbi:MAG: AAA family ATPase [Nitrosomonadales bacterium]|nr:AAA family ATPase [Nitrosomonadales bacterium]
MITKIIIENFKKFERAEIELGHDTILFVGQNNGGKTTALQALSLWSFLAQQWQTKKGGGKAKKRTGAPIPRNEVWAAPVREARMLWNNGDVKDRESKPVNIRITVFGVNGEPWEYGMEATYSNQELLFCKPTIPGIQPPKEAGSVFHLPPLSGVQTSEKRIDLGAQLRVIGEGRPGEILRNLLWQLHENSPGKWSDLKERVRNLFGMELLPIHYNELADPDINVYYRPVLPEKKKIKTPLEIASAGSGFLQFLLLAAFMYVHEESILLIDEPDSHMHVFLQRGMFDWIQEIARKNGSQLIISTHSEVLVNGTTDLERITTFFGGCPKKPALRSRSLIHALREVSPLEVINTEWKKRIFFAEGETDLRVLKAWADTMKHPILPLLDNINFRPLNTNEIGTAKKQFTALQEVIEGRLLAFCLRDGGVSRTKDLPQDFHVYYWHRKEIESYLIHPAVLMRFIEKRGILPLFQKSAEDYLKDNLPPKVYRDPINKSIDGNGSDFLEGFFDILRLPVSKGEYWEIAQAMNKDEIPQEVREVLDSLHIFLKD